MKCPKCNQEMTTGEVSDNNVGFETVSVDVLYCCEYCGYGEWKEYPAEYWYGKEEEVV